MRKFLIFGLNSWARLRLIRHKVHLKISHGVQVYLWRIRSRVPARVFIGSNSWFLSKIIVEKSGAVIKVGNRTFVGAGLISVASCIEIGDDVLMSWGVTVVDHNSHSVQFSKRVNDVEDWTRGVKEWGDVTVAPVFIGNKSWIGFEVKVLKGVTIGEGAIVGAGSVVTKDVPPWTVVAGNPARIIREIPENER